MENTVGRYEHLNRDDESKRGYLFLHPAFPPAGPITMGFGLQSYSPVASILVLMLVLSCCTSWCAARPTPAHRVSTELACKSLAEGPRAFFFSRTRWASRSSERGIPSERAACCQGLTSCKGSDVLSVGDRMQEDNYSAVIFDNTGQYATESKFLVLKEMIFPCLSQYLLLCEIEKCYYPLLVG